MLQEYTAQRSNSGLETYILIRSQILNACYVQGAVGDFWDTMVSYIVLLLGLSLCSNGITQYRPIRDRFSKEGFLEKNTSGLSVEG